MGYIFHLAHLTVSVALFVLSFFFFKLQLITSFKMCLEVERGFSLQETASIAKGDLHCSCKQN